MSRPKLMRTIENPPPIDGFKPIGVPKHQLEALTMFYEEYEAIRLSDYEGLTQEAAALQMSVSRPTFTRIYEKARRTIAKAFVEGKAIVIEGGHFTTSNDWKRCKHCKKRQTPTSQNITDCGCHQTTNNINNIKLTK